MTSPIEGISSLATPLASIGRISATDDAGTTGGASAVGFGDMIGKAIANVQDAQSTAAGLAVKAATGDLQDAHQYMAAATEASLTTQLTVAVRNKAVEAFQEIMRLQG